MFKDEVEKILDECIDDYYRETHPVEEIAEAITTLHNKDMKLVAKGRVIDIIQNEELSELLSWLFLYKEIEIYIKEINHDI